jgi:hypothetical protein
MLRRVTKTLQPSSISSHMPSHHDQRQETTKRMKRDERNRGETRKPKIANKLKKFNYYLSTYIDSLKKLHSISSNYLIFYASWDELAAEQGPRFNTIEGIIFMSINLFSLSLSLKLVFFLLLSLYVSLNWPLLDGQDRVYIGFTA